VGLEKQFVAFSHLGLRLDKKLGLNIAGLKAEHLLYF
jgi:hypothetical protein